MKRERPGCSPDTGGFVSDFMAASRLILRPDLWSWNTSYYGLSFSLSLSSSLASRHGNISGKRRELRDSIDFSFGHGCGHKGREKLDETHVWRCKLEPLRFRFDTEHCCFASPARMRSYSNTIIKRSRKDFGYCTASAGKMDGALSTSNPLVPFLIIIKKVRKNMSKEFSYIDVSSSLLI